jgi:hypothetical protein
MPNTPNACYDAFALHGVTDLPILQNRNYNLALARSVTCNVVRELLYVLHELCCFGGGGGAAYAFAEGDGLAGYLAVEGTWMRLGEDG